ncbi:MAG: hypothetical protein HeimC3_25370 [Candidatus Heimdallarchaeota archaeon LC_3]|nr:MAG: hypothetical protein HeimC3_25370 [Candidatus Heimdallarchaeota archaeon LC_3]
MDEISENIQEKIKKKDKGFISEILNEFYTICRQTGRSCTDCSFEYDKLNFEIGYEKEQFVEMCPLDAALVDYKSPTRDSGKINPWIVENIELVYNRLQELKSE